MAAHPIQALIEAGVAQGAAPGFCAAVRTPRGGTQLFQAGVRGVADPAPMDDGTIFWIASCTKAIVSAAALELVAEGRLDLDEPVGRLLPALARPKVLTGFDAAGAPVLRPAAQPLTLRSLLSHTSGLAYDFNCAEVVRYLEHHGLSLVTAGGLGLPLMFEPGDAWRYGVGIDVAGLLIEAATGESLGEVLERMVFGPLGMADTTFDPSPEQNARRATLHARLPDGSLMPLDPMPAMPPTLRGGGGLVSTAADYLRFLDAILDGGGGVFSPQTIAHLRTPHLRGRSLGALKSVLPQMSNDYEPLAGAEKAWTLGFLQSLEPADGAREPGSLSWAGLANCYYWADPATGVAGVLFAQLLPFADPQVLAVFEAFERAVYAEARPPAAAAGLSTAAADA
ncbi:MAG: beta-lactamase family protein [Caulobacterales bacterium]|nr:beta-lactamase family protein [Caulobacterales bacterium]